MASEDQATGYGGRSTKYKLVVFVGALVLIVSGYVGLTMTPYINQALPGDATATVVSQGTKVASGATVPIKGVATGTIFPIAVIAHTLQETPTSIVPVPTRPVVPTPTVVRNPYPPHQGKLVLNDPLKDNSKGYGWDERTRKKGSCRFVDGVYGVLVESTDEGMGGNVCFAQSTNFNNFVFEMKVYLADYNVFGELVVCPGITFNGGDNGHYLFMVCSDGQYALLAVTKGSIGNFSAQRLTSGRSAAIRKGTGQANLLAVVANQQQFELYINAQKVASVSDDQRSSGQIGCAIFLYLGEGEVQCSDARVWEL